MSKVVFTSEKTGAEVEARVTDSGTCLFCGKKAMVLEHEGSFQIAHEVPTCDAFSLAVKERRPAIIPASMGAN